MLDWNPLHMLTMLALGAAVLLFWLLVISCVVGFG